MLSLIRHQHHRLSLLRLLHHRSDRHFSPSSPPSQPLDVPISQPTYLIWSSNTGLGKTLVSTGVSSSFLLPSSSTSAAKKLIYLKPIQTGFPSDSDSRFLFNKLSSLSLRRPPPHSLSLSDSLLYSSASAAKSLPLPPQTNEFASGMYNLSLRTTSGSDKAVSELVCKTLFAWEAAVSPHLAAERERGLVADSLLLELLANCLRDGFETHREILCLVETAGGVASPAPSGSLQCDLYRPVNLIVYI